MRILTTAELNQTNGGSFDEYPIKSLTAGALCGAIFSYISGSKKNIASYALYYGVSAAALSYFWT